MVPFSLDPPLMGAPKVPPAAWALAGPAVEAPWTGPVPRAPTAPAPLQVVAGRYSLERELGHCGMGDRLSHPGGRPRPPRRDQNAPARFGRPALATRAVPARGPPAGTAVLPQYPIDLCCRRARRSGVLRVGVREHGVIAFVTGGTILGS